MRKSIFTLPMPIIYTTLSCIVFLTIGSPTYADTCAYESAIQTCIDSQWSPRSLPFFCPQSNDAEFIAYQVILDADFTVLDNEIWEYLDQLESNKGQFYSGGKTYFDGYDEISRKFSRYWEYWAQFRKLCDAGEVDSILQKTVQCRWGETSASLGSNFFQEAVCMNLVNVKLNAAKYTADNILRLNRTYITHNRQKSYLSIVRETYSTLVDKFNYNLSLIQKIEKKYPSRTEENWVPN